MLVWFIFFHFSTRLMVDTMKRPSYKNILELPISWFRTAQIMFRTAFKRRTAYLKKTLVP